jgi:inositol phosphorylceramide mannosyltransferase catalytic subunit
MPMLVPKKLFQTAKSFDSLHEDFKRSIAKLREMNPDWAYKFFDDAEMKDYIRHNLSSEEWHDLEHVNPKYGVVLADLFRYILIYNEGGIYLDVKSTARQPLSSAIDPDVRYVISQWPNKLGQRFPGYGLHPELANIPGGEFQQWNIIAEPGHAFLKAVIKQVLHNIRTYTPGQFGTDAYGVLRVSGPIAYTKAISPLLDHYPHNVINLDECGIQYSIYEGIGPGHSHTKLPGHYSTINEPIILRDVYIEPPQPVVTRLGDLLAQTLRDNADLALKLAVFSIFSTATLLILIVVGVFWFAARG